MTWIFFDLGSTLEDESAAEHDRAVRTAAAVRELGMNLGDEEYIAMLIAASESGAPDPIGHSLAELGLSRETVAQVKSRAPWIKSSLVLYPDSRDTLAALHGQFGLGIIANQSRGSPARLREYGIHDMLGVVLTSAEIGLAKPDPRIFELAERRTGTTPDRLWMVGDRPDNDVAPSKERGWHTIRILRGWRTGYSPRAAAEEADFTVHTLHEIPPILGVRL